MRSPQGKLVFQNYNMGPTKPLPIFKKKSNYYTRSSAQERQLSFDKLFQNNRDTATGFNTMGRSIYPNNATLYDNKLYTFKVECPNTSYKPQRRNKKSIEPHEKKKPLPTQTYGSNVFQNIIDRSLREKGKSELVRRNVNSNLFQKSERESEAETNNSNNVESLNSFNKRFIDRIMQSNRPDKGPETQNKNSGYPQGTQNKAIQMLFNLIEENSTLPQRNRSPDAYQKFAQQLVKMGKMSTEDATSLMPTQKTITCGRQYPKSLLEIPNYPKQIQIIDARERTRNRATEAREKEAHPMEYRSMDGEQGQQLMHAAEWNSVGSLEKLNINSTIKKQLSTTTNRFPRNMPLLRIRNTNSSKTNNKKPPAVMQEFFTEESLVLFTKENTPSEQSSNPFQKYCEGCQIFGQSISILQNLNGKQIRLYEHQATNQVEIASLTKTMTCLLALLLAQKFELSKKKTLIKVSQKAATLKGTSAGLQYCDHVALEDLLHGLMLPSGNDAATAIAQWGGKFIRMKSREVLPKAVESPSNKNLKPGLAQMSMTATSKQTESIFPKGKRTHVGLFIYHMNKLAKTLRLTQTHFANPHGLMNKNNYSTANDITRLCSIVMARPDFRKIVNTKEYSCKIENRKFSSVRTANWKNTNRLLLVEGFCGVKTGITPSAGPCLASCFRVSEREEIYIVLLNTKSVSHRFQQSKVLLIEALKSLYSRTGLKEYSNWIGILDKNKQDLEVKEDQEDRNNIYEPVEGEFVGQSQATRMESES